MREEDIGKSRAEATVARLAELNTYVPVRNLGGQAGQRIAVDMIKNFQVTLGFFILGIYWFDYYSILVGNSLRHTFESTTRNK